MAKTLGSYTLERLESLLGQMDQMWVSPKIRAPIVGVLIQGKTIFFFFWGGGGEGVLWGTPILANTQMNSLNLGVYEVRGTSLGPYYNPKGLWVVGSLKPLPPPDLPRCPGVKSSRNLPVRVPARGTMPTNDCHHDQYIDNSTYTRAT